MKILYPCFVSLYQLYELLFTYANTYALLIDGRAGGKLTLLQYSFSSGLLGYGQVLVQLDFPLQNFAVCTNTSCSHWNASQIV